MENEKIRILYIIPNLKKGGAERLLLNIAAKINERKDAECCIIVLNEGNDYEALSANMPIELCHSKVKLSISKKHKADITHFIEIVERYKPHIIHSHLFEAEVLSRWHIFPHIKYISHIHNNEKQLRNFSIKTLLNKERLTNFYEKKFILNRYKACNNHFIAISKTTETYLKKTLPKALHKNIKYLPNAIDYGAFFFDRVDSGFTPTYNLITIGRLVKSKNQAFLVDVIAELHKKNKPATLNIFGVGPEYDNIQEKINRHGMEDYIKLCGTTDNIQDMLKSSSLYLHAATYEPFGLVLLEAMASGLPVVTLDGGGNREIMINGRNGFIIKKADPQLFAERVIETINCKPIYRKMGQNAQTYAKSHDIIDYTKKELSIYKCLLADNI